MQGDGEVRRPRGLKLRNGIWWIDKAVRHGSKSIQIRESTGCRDLKSAIRVFDIRVNGVVPLAGHDLDLDAYKAWVGRLRRNCQKNARDREFRLTEDEVWGLVFRANGRCEVSGMPFDISMPRKGRKKPFAPSIDRIDISKGYVVENCRLVCTIVNLAMNVWGEEPLWRLVEHMQRTSLNEPARKLVGAAGIEPAT